MIALYAIMILIPHLVGREGKSFGKNGRNIGENKGSYMQT
jgi:hypothetical protein